MAVSSPAYTVLMLTTDVEVQAQLKQTLRDVSVTVARDAAAFQKETSKHHFDAVIVESRGTSEKAMSLPVHVDPSRTLVIVGSRAVLKKTVKTIQLQNPLHGHPSHQGKSRDASLESYLEMKMGDFVRGMMTGAAKNLHPILISAVERPPDRFGTSRDSREPDSSGRAVGTEPEYLAQEDRGITYSPETHKKQSEAGDLGFPHPCCVVSSTWAGYFILTEGGDSMTKEEIIAKMAASAGITKVAAGTALEAFTGAVTSSLKKGQRVSLVNFGTFTISKRKARMGRNPRTGESLRIPAVKVPKFSAGKELKSAVK